jgi:GNAT superfamily N-acetyltransferase
VFREHRRQPMVEYAAERWPQLGPALERAGFAGEVPLIAMAHDGTSLRPASPAASAPAVRRLDGSTPLPVLGTYLTGLHAIFDERRPIAVGIEEAARLQRALASGRTHICMVEGENGDAIAGANLVGIGPVPGMAGPVAELSGVWVAAAMRGRGLTRSVVGALLERFFVGGGLVWLAADDRLATGLYAGLGFRQIGRQLRYSLHAT